MDDTANLDAFVCGMNIFGNRTVAGGLALAEMLKSS
jgi:hypothetical protein